MRWRAKVGGGCHDQADQGEESSDRVDDEDGGERTPGASCEIDVARLITAIARDTIWTTQKSANRKGLGEAELRTCIVSHPDAATLRALAPAEDAKVNIFECRQRDPFDDRRRQSRQEQEDKGSQK
jgi:hypothetical protein